MDFCAKCNMPLDESTKCACNPSLCFHCCACDAECSCGCSEMIDQGEEEEEE